MGSLPPKFKNYKIITGEYTESIMDEVNEHLAKGAVLVGGLVIAATKHEGPPRVYYGQAIAYPI